MIRKNKDTQIMQDAYRRYYWSDEFDIYDAYDRPSRAKVEAWKRCQKLMQEHDGWGLAVIGHCTSNFSAGFLFRQDGKLCFAYITKTYTRYCEIEDIDDLLDSGRLVD